MATITNVNVAKCIQDAIPDFSITHKLSFLPVVSFLDCDQDTYTWALRKGHEHIVRYLIATGDEIEIDQYDLETAAMNGHESIVRLLVKHGEDTIESYDDAAKCAARNGHMSLVKYFLEKGANAKKAIIGAVVGGHLNIVKFLVDRTKKMPKGIMTYAAEYGHESVAEFLVKMGADMHEKRSFRHKSIFSHWAPIDYAINKGHCGVTKFLIDHGAKINDDMVTYAAGEGFVEVLHLLLDHGGDKDTALIAAAEYGHEDVVQSLIDRGADVFAKKSKALRRAARNGHESVVILLTRAMHK